MLINSVNKYSPKNYYIFNKLIGDESSRMVLQSIEDKSSFDKLYTFNSVQ